MLGIMVNSTAVTELFRSADLLVRCRPGTDTSRWVVTFDSYNALCDSGGLPLERLAFGEEFLARRGISMIAAVGCDNRWYQYPDMPQALDNIAAVTRGAAKVLTYGSSMGGYAALRFADAVQADIVLAFSPQYCADRRTVPFETRWRKARADIPWLPQFRGRLSCRATPLVLYDSRFWPDVLHAALIARDTPTQRIPLPHAGHPVTTYLAEIGILQDMVPALLEDRFELAEFVRAARAGQRNSRVHRHERSRVLHKLWPF